jgi:hypothetical protein
MFWIDVLFEIIVFILTGLLGIPLTLLSQVAGA